ncbi:hypothetical protein N2K84_09910 [Prolixibacteraceae bacterium A06]|uniref:Phage holin family protein n=2 Tax=Gaoshiqia sediminis TaxID=2986998 RepID=A0AA41Y415_9BACT|nr:hypothetical protein [Gaoshiqia sediminis]
MHKLNYHHMKSNLSDNFHELNQSVQDYLKVRLDLVKLTLLEKMTKISVFLISTVVFILLGMIFFLFATTAFVVWYGNQFQDYLTGLFIVTGVVVLIGLLFLLLRKSLITTTIIQKLSSILFEEDEE